MGISSWTEILRLSPIDVSAAPKNIISLDRTNLKKPGSHGMTQMSIIEVRRNTQQGSRHRLYFLGKFRKGSWMDIGVPD